MCGWHALIRDKWPRFQSLYILSLLHACIMKSYMPEVLYYAYMYVPCILHRYASATEMGLQHTCDVPPSVKAWMVLCMEYLHAADTENVQDVC